jgi:hypothetical protein
MTEITAFWATLQDQHSAHPDAHKAQIITMASPRDVFGMRWLGIDLGGTYVIHAGRVWQVLAGNLAE